MSDTFRPRAHAVLVPLELGLVAAPLPNTLEALAHAQFCPYPTQLPPFDTEPPVLTPSPTLSSAHTEGQHSMAGQGVSTSPSKEGDTGSPEMLA